VFFITPLKKNRKKRKRGIKTAASFFPYTGRKREKRRKE